MECVYTELNKLREVVADKEKEIMKLQREIHKLKSVLERSELKRMPSVSSSQGILTHHTKKCGVSGESWDETTDLPGLDQKQRISKDFRTRQLLRTAIGDNDFLKNLDIDQIRDIVDFMHPVTFCSGEFIINEGEPGSHLYVSAEGVLEVLQDGVQLGTLGPGKAFGELALLYNCKRTASVRAIGNCKVWALERRAFQQAMVKVGMRRIEDRITFLKSVSLLRGLQPLLLSRIADNLDVECFPAGTYIIREGAVGDTFFIISQGKVEVTVSKTKSPSPPDASKKAPDFEVIRQLGYGDYFGEQALLKEEKRSASVLSLGCECLTLDRDSFLQLIGNLSEFKQHLKTGTPPVFSGAISPEPKLNIAPVSQNSTDAVAHGQFEGAETKVSNVDIEQLKLDDLEIIATLGVGGFGRVELVQVAREPSTVFALKCLPKAKILATQQKEHVYAEKNIMLSCNSPFIAKLHKTFRDTKCIYLLMEACLGGEVWTLLRDKGSFDKDTTRFTVGCVLLALEYLHDRNIIYRDLKPENLMLSNSGYVKLVDFGFSKVVPSGQRAWTFCGTPEYVAPEVILNRGHDRSVDLWALGILMFELLTGLPPWGPMSVDGMSSEAIDPVATYNNILKGIESVQFPKNIGRGAVLLIRHLCRQNPGERLGAQNGVADVLTHRWFQGFDWNGLRQGKVKPPIEPRLKSPRDTSNFDKFELEIEDTPDDTSGWDADF